MLTARFMDTVPADLPFVHKASSYYKAGGVWVPCGRVITIKEADDGSGRIVCANCGGRAVKVGS